MKFRERLIEEVEFPELDLEWPFYGPGVDNDGDEERNDVEPPEEDIWSETVSMDIDQAITALEEMKHKGANRVYFYAHGDHHSYIFTGVKLESDADS